MLAERRKGSDSVIAFCAGLVQTDPELKKSEKGNPYLSLKLDEKIGYGELMRTQSINVWAWGNLALQLDEAGVRKGSLIWVTGTLELTDFVRKDGVTQDKALKLKLREWGHIGSGNIAEKAFPKPFGHGMAEVLDGDRESLPD